MMQTFAARVDAEAAARKLVCAECASYPEPHLVQDPEHEFRMVWTVRCTASRGVHRLRLKGKGAIEHYVMTGEGTAITRQQAERRYQKMVDERGIAVRVGDGTDPGMSGELVPLTKEQYLARLDLMEAVVSRMKDGIDFGTIPGTSKPTMYLPGAEMLRMAFNIPVRSETLEKTVDMDKDGGYVAARVRGYVQDASGHVHYEVIRSCSSMEPRFNPWRGSTRRHELIDLVEERAQKRAFVHAVRHMTGASRYFLGAAVDAAEAKEPEAPVSQAGLSVEKCPLHGTAWFENKYGFSHKITGTQEYCKPGQAYRPALEAVVAKAGWNINAVNPWIKEQPEYTGKTWSALTPAQCVEVIAQIGQMVADLAEPEPTPTVDGQAKMPVG